MVFEMHMHHTQSARKRWRWREKVSESGMDSIRRKCDTYEILVRHPFQLGHKFLLHCCETDLYFVHNRSNTLTFRRFLISWSKLIHYTQNRWTNAISPNSMVIVLDCYRMSIKYRSLVSLWQNMACGIRSI